MKASHRVMLRLTRSEAQARAQSRKACSYMHLHPLCMSQKIIPWCCASTIGHSQVHPVGYTLPKPSIIVMILQHPHLYQRATLLVHILHTQNRRNDYSNFFKSSL